MLSHTHTRDAIRDVSRTLPQQVQDRLTQKSCSWFSHLAQKSSLEQKVVLTFSVLANICRPVMETVSVLPFGKFRENRKNIWRKYGENVCNILVLTFLFCSGFNQRSHWNVISLTCPSYASQICPASFDQSFGHRYVYDISVHSLSQAFQQLWFRAFMSRFWQASFFLECQPVSPSVKLIERVHTATPSQQWKFRTCCVAKQPSRYLKTTSFENPVNILFPTVLADFGHSWT